MNGTISLQSKLKGAVTMANTIINGGASPNPKTVGPAAIASFSDGALDAPLKSLTFGIEPVQSGSGDPSPTNIRPISGWTQVSGKHSGADMTDYTPITIPLGQTVYGGYVDAVKGKLVVDRVTHSLTGSETVSLLSNSRRFVISNATLGWKLPKPTTNAANNDAEAFASHLVYSKGTLDATFGHFRIGADNSLQIYDSGSAYASTTAFKSWLSEQNSAGTPVQICYLLATPLEYDLTPQTIKTLLGVNNIWADSGETTLEYYPAAASIVSVLNRSSKVYTSIPLGKIRYETYQITPQQTIDLDSYRSENGNLLRNPVATKCKIEFNTPLMTDSEWAEIWKIIKAGFNNNTERKLKLKYYDTLSATYKTGYFYVPDVQTTIRNIEEGAGVINYNEIRIAFIEY